MMTILFKICLLSLSVAGVLSAPKKQDECDLSEYDKCASVALIFGDRSAFIPKDLIEMEKRCDIDKVANDCWRRNLNACVKEPLTRQVLSLILQSIERMVKLRCHDEEYQQEFVNAIGCIYDVLDGIHNCMDQFVRNATLIATVSDPEYQIPLICCTYNTFSQCSFKEIGKKCGETEAKFVEDFLEGYAGDVLGLMCAGYLPGSPECNVLDFPTFQPDMNIDFPKSLIPPIISVLTELTKAG